MKIPWYSVFSFLFLLRNNGKQNKWMRTTSVAVMVIFFESVIANVLDHSYVQSFSQQLRRILIMAFERHLRVEDFTNMD